MGYHAGALCPFVMLSVFCYFMQTMEKSMGERRLTYHAPVGISVGEPLDIAGVMGDASALKVVIACSLV